MERLEDRALLTDLTPPVLVSATPVDDQGGATFSHVKLVFDEAVATPSATNAQNYRLVNATGSYLAVTSAAVDATDSTGKTIILTCAAQSAGVSYSVHVGGVADLAGNASPQIGRNYTASATLISGPRAMTLGDFDNDGVQDVITSSNNDRDVWFHKGISGGSFATPVLTISDTTTFTVVDLASGDLDGDGNLDLITPVTDGTLKTIVFWGNGDGTFSAGHVQTGLNSYHVAVGDLDGDSDLDFVVSSGTAGFATYINPWNPLSGSPASQATVRSFETWSRVATPTLGSVDIHIGDVNLDGFADVVSLYPSNSSPQIFLGTGIAGIYLPTVTLTGTPFGWENTLADVTGDGRLDLVGSYNGGLLQGTILSPFFLAPTATTITGLDFVKAADLDSDGDLDLIGGVSGGSTLNPNVYIAYNQGGGVFEPVRTISLGEVGLKHIGTVETRDINGDGLLDIIGIDVTGTKNFFALKSQIGASAASFTFAPNHAPSPSAGGAYSIHEGDSLTLNAAGSTDPDGDALAYSWDINNDGVFGDATGVSPTLTWSQLVALGINDNGSYTVAVRATDPRGWPATSSTTLAVEDTAPVVSISGSSTGTEGSVYTLSLSATDDPGADTVTGWTIDWGDGTTSTASGTSATHVYANDGDYTITAKAIDEDGLHDAASSISVAVANVLPTLSVGGDGNSNEGSAFTRNGSFSDPGADAWIATVDYGDGTGSQNLALNADKTFSLNHVYVDNGSYSVTVTINDDKGSTSATFSVSVANVTPTVTLSGPASGTANQNATFNAVLTNQNVNDTYTLTWKVFRNGSATPIITSSRTDSLAFTFSAAVGSYVVTLDLTDDDGSAAAQTAAYTVASITDAAADIIGYANGQWTVGTSNSPASPAFTISTTGGPTWGAGTGPIATGDFNGDGATDVLRLEGTSLHVGIASSGTFVDWPSAPLGLGTYTNLAVGDVNGDGRTDVLTRLNGTWYASLSTGSGFADKTAWGTGWSTAVTWADMQLADLDGDGRADLLGRTNYQWYAALSTGSAFGSATLWTGWGAFAWDMTGVLDANGDGKTDLLGRLGGAWYVAFSSGANANNTALNGVTTNLWASWSSTVSWTDSRVGDFNGDQKTDIIARTGGSWYVGLSNGTSGVTTSPWGGWNPTLTWQDVRVGDFTGDGKADIAGRWNDSWYVSTSAGNAFNNGTLWGTGWTATTYSFVGVGRVASAPAPAPLASPSVKSTSSAAVAAASTQAKTDSLALFWSSTKDDERFAAALLSASKA